MATSATLTLMNPIVTTRSPVTGEDVQDYLWTPSPVKGRLWSNTKFKIVSVLQLQSEAYWIDEGVFVCQDPELDHTTDNKLVTITLYDKFAMLDGTIQGTMDSDLVIPRGQLLSVAINNLLQLPKDADLNPLDSKPIVFPAKYEYATVSYDLQKNAGDTVGSVIIALADTISCVALYNSMGHLTLVDNQDLYNQNKSVAWSYAPISEGLEFNDVKLKINWSQIRNKFIVIGSNINGLLVRGEATNDNPSSLYNVKSSFGIHTEIINDSLINTPQLCKDRADYELQKNIMKHINLQLSSIYVPHLRPNDLIRLTFPDFEIDNDLFLVQSLSVPLDGKSWMNLNCVNVNELPFT